MKKTFTCTSNVEVTYPDASKIQKLKCLFGQHPAKQLLYIDVTTSTCHYLCPSCGQTFAIKRPELKIYYDK